MECTGGFRSLRRHVHGTKRSGTRPSSGAKYRPNNTTPASGCRKSCSSSDDGSDHEVRSSHMDAMTSSRLVGHIEHGELRLLDVASDRASASSNKRPVVCRSYVCNSACSVANRCSVLFSSCSGTCACMIASYARVEIRHNQERLWEDEQHLNALRVRDVLLQLRRAISVRAATLISHCPNVDVAFCRRRL